MDIHGPLREFVIAHCFDGRAPVDFGDDSELIESGLIDSFLMMTLVSHAETEFGIRVGIGDLVPENFRTVNAMASFVRSRRSGT